MSGELVASESPSDHHPHSPGRHVWVRHRDHLEAPVHYHIRKRLPRGYTHVNAVDTRCGTKRVLVKHAINGFERVAAWEAEQEVQRLQLQCACRHENIVRVHSMYLSTTANGRDTLQALYVVEGHYDTDLATVIRSKQPLLVEHIRYFMWQILSALAYVHSGDVTLRVLTPLCMMLTADCKLALGAEAFTDSRRCPAGTTVAVPWELPDLALARGIWFQAPEMIFNGCAQPASNIWAAGCVMAELLLRVPLFPGKCRTDQLLLIAKRIEVPPVCEWSFVAADERLQRSQAHLCDLSASRVGPFGGPMGYADGDAEMASFLQSMLAFDPVKRPTAQQLLHHPFLAPVWDGPIALCSKPLPAVETLGRRTKAEAVEDVLNLVRMYAISEATEPLAM